MKLNNYNTVKIMIGLEQSLIMFAKEYDEIVSDNASRIEKIENDYSTEFEQLGDKSEKKDAISKRFKDEKDRMIDERRIREENLKRDAAEFQAEIDSKILECKEKIAKEHKEAEEYIQKITDLMRLFDKFVNKEIADEVPKDLVDLWATIDFDEKNCLKYADDRYHSLFCDTDSNYILLETIKNEFFKCAREAVQYKYATGIKSMQLKKQGQVAKGNMAYIIVNLLTFSNREKTRLSVQQIDLKCTNLYREIENFQQQRRDVINKLNQDIEDINNDLQYRLNKHEKNEISDIAKMGAKFEQDTEAKLKELKQKKDSNRSEFLSNKDKLKKKIEDWLDDNLSVDSIIELNNKRSNISDYSDTQAFTPVCDDRHYVKMGRLELDYKSHEEINKESKPEFIKWITDYYAQLNFNGKIVVPFIIDLTDFSNIQISCDNSRKKTIINAARSISLHFFGDLKAGLVRFTFIDPTAFGSTFAPFMQFITSSVAAKAIVNQGTCTITEHAEELLSSLENGCRNINSNFFTEDYSNIIEYNDRSRPNIIPINIIIVMDFPNRLLPSTVEKMQNLIQHSKKCGFHFIFIGNCKAQNNQASFDFLGGNASTVDMPAIDWSYDKDYISISNTIDDRFLINNSKIEVVFDEMYTDEKMRKIAPVMKKNLAESGNIVVPMEKIEYMDTKNIGEALTLPFALVGANDIREISFGDRFSNHLVIVGSTRSGKSNTLHVLIMSALEKYTPDEVQIILLDYKLAVEAYRYSKYRLPHFKIISTTKNLNFGMSVIEYIENEMVRRENLFTRNGCINYSEYYDKKKKDPNLENVPRLLVIIDELHALVQYDEHSKSKDSVDHEGFCVKLDTLIRTCVSFGIHLVFSTQMGGELERLGSLDIISSAIVYKCDSKTERIILGDGKEEAQHFLSADKGLAIYASDRSNPYDNQRVHVAYMSSEEEKQRLERIELRYEDVFCGTRVNAKALENRIDNPIFKFVNPKMEEVSFDLEKITIGEELDVEGDGEIQFTGNMLLVGNNEKMARGFIETIITSILCRDIANGIRPLIKFVELTDELSRLKAETDLIYKYNMDLDKDPFPVFQYFNCVQYTQACDDIRNSLTYEGPKYYFIFGLTDHSFDLFNNLLQESDENFHVIAWCDNYSVFFNKQYDKQLLSIEHRIVFNAPESDTKSLTSSKTDLTRSDYAIYKNINKPSAGRPYAAYNNNDTVWADKLIAKLNSRLSKIANN